MRHLPTSFIAGKSQDLRIVRTTGRTIEQILLDQEDEQRWLLEVQAAGCTTEIETPWNDPPQVTNPEPRHES